MSDPVLLHTPASPFARKVRVVALLRAVTLELRPVPLDPVRRNPDVAAQSPLAKIPVLLTAEGPLYDSRVICRYLDALGAGPGLYDGPAPWEILRLEALADGIMEAAVLLRYERAARPEALRWPDWIAAQRDRIAAALDLLEPQAAALEVRNAGAVGLAVALSYLDFRHPDLPWRARHPRLSDWLLAEAATPPMEETAFPAP